MKQNNLKYGIVAACLLAAGGVSALGAGYGIYEGSARANAMGSEVTADPESPSVIYNNIAAMTELEGTQVEVGATFIKPRQTIVTDLPSGSQKTFGTSRWWTLPTGYVTHQINERFWAGLGLFTRVGLGAEFPYDWAGRYSVQNAEIVSFDVNPSMAFKVTDRFSLAGGFRVEYFDFELKRAIPTGTPFVDPDASLKLTGENFGMGYNFGAYWKPIDRISLGLAYESQITHDIMGSYTMTMQDVMLSSGTVYGDFSTPALVRFGTSIQATEKWKINAGVVYTLWSCYDQMRMHFDPALMGSRSVSTSLKNWHDTFRWQFGTEYTLSDAWAVRCGYIYDKTPDPDYLIDYMVPANNRHLVSLGVGWKHDNYFVDAAYTYLIIEDRTVKGHIEDGVWDGHFVDGDAHMVSLSTGYRF